MGLILALLLTQTPNMSLPLVTPGVTTDLQFENAFNQAMGTIDGHNHSPGEGVLVPVGGLTIQAPLPYNGWPATEMGYLGIVDAGAGPSQNLTLWNDGINFWVQDGLGNKIKLTAGGAITGVGCGDGGNCYVNNLYASTSVTANGMSLSGLCFTGQNGASYCFSSGPGDLNLNAVDGGVIYLNGQSLAQVNGFGFTENGGVSVGAGFPVAYDPSLNGYTEEEGQNLVTSVPDGGIDTVVCGSTTNLTRCFQLAYDGGVPLTVTALGITEMGDPTYNETVRIVPQVSGTGMVYIQARSPIADKNIGIQIQPKGDGGVILAGHIDTAAGTPTVTWPTGAPPDCFGDAGMGSIGNPSLLSGSNDSAGFIVLPYGGGATYCAPGVQIALLTFANAYSGDAGYVTNLPSVALAGYGALTPLVASQSAGSFSVTYECSDTVLINHCDTEPTSSILIPYTTIGIGANSH